eukprot:s777_g27.t1
MNSLQRWRSLSILPSEVVCLTLEAILLAPTIFEKKEIGCINAEDAVVPAVQPYASLNADRLKLVGRGEWRLDKWLLDEFYLPYLEPRILHHGRLIDVKEGPNFSKESPEEYKKLAKKWEGLGLLGFTPHPPPQKAFTRVLNAYKNAENDRQIGDRRLSNQLERSMQGPSKFLPGGCLMTSLHVPAKKCIYGAVTDRKDFYHQSCVSHEGARSNVTPFTFPQSDFAGTQALHDLQQLEGPGGGRDMSGGRGILAERGLVYPTKGITWVWSSHYQPMEPFFVMRVSFVLLRQFWEIHHSQ